MIGLKDARCNWSLPYGLDFKKVFNVEPVINVNTQVWCKGRTSDSKPL